jgi:hypothetical protein
MIAGVIRTSRTLEILSSQMQHLRIHDIENEDISPPLSEKNVREFIYMVEDDLLQSLSRHRERETSQLDELFKEENFTFDEVIPALQIFFSFVPHPQWQDELGFEKSIHNFTKDKCFEAQDLDTLYTITTGGNHGTICSKMIHKLIQKREERNIY